MKQSFRIIIAGGRDFDNYEVLKKTLDHLLSKIVDTHEIIIVSGAARGADKLGEKYANERGFKIDSHPANWDLGKGAGFIRNSQMAEAADACVIFWDGVSSGSAHMVKTAQKKRLPLRIYDYSGKAMKL
jgi:predicted GTPase